MRLHHLALLVPILVLSSACNLMRVDSRNDPPRIQSRGLIEAHAAIGIPSEEHLFHLDLFDGRSSGAVAELVIWKLLRLEIGLAGASIGIGPFHLGLGVLAYSPEVPAMMEFGDEDDHTEGNDRDDPDHRDGQDWNDDDDDD